MNNEKTNYIKNYQSFLFQVSENDSYKTADAKRKCLAQNLKACSILGDENLANSVIENNLKDLSTLIDNKKSINRYIGSVNNLITSSDHCQEWKNELKLDDFEDLMKPLLCCSTPEIPNDEIASLFKKRHRSNEVKIFKNELLKFKNETESLPSVPKYKNQLVDEQSQSAKRNNCGMFKTARDELDLQNSKKYNNSKPSTSYQQQQLNNYVPKKSLGGRRGVQSKFVPPVRVDSSNNDAVSKNSQNSDSQEEDEHLKNIEPRMIEMIRSEIMDSGNPISWDDIAGLEFAKTVIKEVVVWPLLRPDIFTGLRRPPKGILLFGPPGTGKTLIGKCIASQSKSTFFSISASSLTSKWIGDGEKMVRAMFAVARCHQPAVIFIDEIDSLLCQRSDSEHESSRRIKTEFLVQLDGAATGEEDRILLIGATNRPQELDEAARRRFVKRLYIPLPEKTARLEIVKRLMKTERNNLTEENISEIANLSEGYSGADMKSLCSEAALGPIRSIDIRLIQNIEANEVRAITIDDFRSALARVKASVSSGDLETYVKWDQTYGAGGW